MRCPYCGKDDTRVIDSRPVEDNNSIRRRRICDSCGKRFTTYEKIEMIPMMVTKKDNNREAYDRSKIEGGILRACHKRPVSAAQIKKVVDEIEAEIKRIMDEIESNKGTQFDPQIADIMLKLLKENRIPIEVKRESQEDAD